MPKDLTDILDIQRYGRLPTPNNYKNLPEIKYIAGDLFHMGEFKKWVVCMPIVAYAPGSHKNIEILYTSISKIRIPIKLENYDSHKVLAKRSKMFLNTLLK